MKKVKILFLCIIIGISIFGIYKKITTTTIKHYDTNIVILDAGHGDTDSGATNGKYKEKDINLKVVKMIGKKLEKKGIEVIYTRQDDQRLNHEKFEDLKLRAELSKKKKAHYFVSIHVNDYEKSNDVSGFEIYTNDDHSSRKLASEIGFEMAKLNYSVNRGVKDGSHLRVLRLNEVPAILIELGYINGKDITYLTNNQKLDAIAKAISDGIIERMN